MELDEAILYGSIAAGSLRIAKDALPEGVAPFSKEGREALSKRITSGVVRRKTLKEQSVVGKQMIVEPGEVHKSVGNIYKRLNLKKEIDGSQTFAGILDWLDTAARDAVLPGRADGWTELSSVGGTKDKIKAILERSSADPMYGRKLSELSRKINKGFVPKLQGGFKSTIVEEAIKFKQFEAFQGAFKSGGLTGDLATSGVYKQLERVYGSDYLRQNLGKVMEATEQMLGHGTANSGVVRQARDLMQGSVPDLLFNSMYEGPSGMKMGVDIGGISNSLEMKVPFLNPKTGSMMIGGQEFRSPMVLMQGEEKFISTPEAMLRVLKEKFLVESDKGGWNLAGTGREFDQGMGFFTDPEKYLRNITKQFYGNDFWAARQSGSVGFLGQHEVRAGVGAEIASSKGIHVSGLFPSNMISMFGGAEGSAQDIERMRQRIAEVNPSLVHMLSETQHGKGMVMVPLEMRGYGGLGGEFAVEQLFPGGMASGRSQYFREMESIVAKGAIHPDDISAVGNNTLLKAMQKETGTTFYSPRTLAVPGGVAKLAAREQGLHGLQVGGELQMMSESALSKYKGQTLNNVSLSLTGETSYSPFAEALQRDFKDYILNRRLSETTEQAYGSHLRQAASKTGNEFWSILQTEGGRNAMQDMIKTHDNYGTVKGKYEAEIARLTGQQDMARGSTAKRLFADRIAEETAKYEREAWKMTNVQELLDQSGALGMDYKSNTIRTAEDIARQGDNLRLGGVGVYGNANDMFMGITFKHEYDIRKIFTTTGEKGIVSRLGDPDLRALAKKSEAIMQTLYTKGVSVEAMEGAKNISDLEGILRSKNTTLDVFLKEVKAFEAGNAKFLQERVADVERMVFEAMKHPKSRGLSGSLDIMAGELHKLRKDLRAEQGPDPKKVRRARELAGRIQGKLDEYGWKTIVREGGPPTTSVAHSGAEFNAETAQRDFKQLFADVSHHTGRLHMSMGSKGAWGVYNAPIMAGAPPAQHGFRLQAALSQDLYGGVRKMFGDEVSSKMLARATTIEGLEMTELYKMARGVEYGTGSFTSITGKEGHRTHVLNLAEYQKMGGRRRLKSIMESKDVYGELGRALKEAGLTAPSQTPDTYAINLGKGSDLVIPRGISGDTSYLGHFKAGDRTVRKPATRAFFGMLDKIAGGTEASKELAQQGRLQMAQVADMLGSAMKNYKPPLGGAMNLELGLAEEGIQELFGKKGILRQELMEGIGKGVKDPEKLIAMVRGGDMAEMFRGRGMQGARSSGPGLQAYLGALIRHPSPDIGKVASPIAVDFGSAIGLARAKHAGNTTMLRKIDRIAKSMESGIQEGRVGLSQTLMDFVGGDLDADLTQLALLNKEEQELAKDFFRNSGDTLVENMETHIALGGWKKSQAMEPYLPYFRDKGGRVNLAMKVARSSEMQQKTIGQVYNVTKPMFDHLATIETQSSGHMRALLQGLYESSTITSLKQENPQELLGAAERFAQSITDHKGSPATAEAFEDLVRLSEYGKQLERYRAPLPPGQKMAPDVERFGKTFEGLREMFGKQLPQGVLDNFKVQEALTRKAVGRATEKEFVFDRMFLGLLDNTAAGHQLSRIGIDPDTGLSRQVQSTSEGINRTMQNVSQMIADSKAGRKILLYGGGVALGAALLFGGDSRMDLKEEELQAARDELGRQGLAPPPSADFRDANRGRITLGGLRVRGQATIGGAIESGGNMAGQLNSAFNGGSTNVRYHDDRIDLTAERAQRMARSGRSYY